MLLLHFMMTSNKQQGWKMLALSLLCLVAAATGLSAANIASESCIHGRRVCVVGGGPVALATALTLSRPPHSCDVTVLEKSSGESFVGKYDPGKAYLYNINRRGLSWVKQYPEVFEKLEKNGATTPPAITIIPADPNVPIPNPTVVPSFSKKDKELDGEDSYWIPRHGMVDLLQQCCLAQEKSWKKARSEAFGYINIMTDKDVVSVEPLDSAGKLLVQCADGSSMESDFIVAADGMNSTVRSVLADSPSRAASHSTWLQSESKQFKVKQYKSPSTGLKLRALQFPPSFTIPSAKGEDSIIAESSALYAFRGMNKGSRNFVSLGFLPMKDPDSIRPGNIITRYDHDVWSIQTGTEMKNFFQKCFPRIDFDAIIDGKEWDRFTAAKGTTFPFCQYSPGSAMVSPNGSTGVALVGDACHAFPPDIGQGINAGFLDVLALDRALQGKDITSGERGENQKQPTLKSALFQYQQNRKDEHRSLIRLARFGAPYQYRQSWKRDQVGKFFWSTNVAIRLLLNKISLGAIPPAAVLIMPNEKLTYRQIMRKADTTTALLKITLLLPFAIWFAKKLMLRA